MVRVILPFVSAPEVFPVAGIDVTNDGRAANAKLSPDFGFRLASGVHLFGLSLHLLRPSHVRPIVKLVS